MIFPNVNVAAFNFSLPNTKVVIVITYVSLRRIAKDYFEITSKLIYINFESINQKFLIINSS